jgi:hypothetical protein
MINPEHGLSLTRQAGLLQLSRASIYYEPVGTSQADLKLMRRIDELHLAFPGQPNAAQYASPRRHRDRAQTRCDADAKDGHRGELPARQHEPAASATCDLSVSAEKSDHRSTQSSPGDRRDVHPDGARLCVFGRGTGLVQPPGVELVGLQQHDRTSASRHSRKPSAATVRRRSSTRTRARNLPQQASSMCCRETKSASAWMDAVRGATTCSSNACGSRSSTKRSICMRTTPSRRLRPESNVTFPSTTAGVHTRHLTDRLPITFTSTLSRSRRPHNPRSCTYPDREICLNLWDHLSFV